MSAQISEVFANLSQSGFKKCAIVDANGFTQESQDFNPQNGFKVKVLSDLAKNISELLGDQFVSLAVVGDGDEHLVSNLSNDMSLYVSK